MSTCIHPAPFWTLVFRCRKLFSCHDMTNQSDKLHKLISRQEHQYQDRSTGALRYSLEPTPDGKDMVIRDWDALALGGRVNQQVQGGTDTGI